MYGGGIFDSCNKTAPNINHAVVLDGYGTESLGERPKRALGGQGMAWTTG